MKVESKELELFFTENGLDILKDALNDINKLNYKIMIYVEAPEIIIYTIIGEEGDYKGFKIIKLPIDDIFKNFEYSKRITCHLDVRKFLSVINFLDGETKILFTFDENNTYCYNIRISDIELSFRLSIQNPSDFKRIEWVDVENVIVKSPAELEINTNGSLLSKINKLIKLSEDTEVFVLQENNGNGKIVTSNWEMILGTSKIIEPIAKNKDYYIKSKYISSIPSKSENIVMMIYDNRVAVRDNSNIPSLYLFPLDLIEI